jgi:Tfp pilus assembly protein PilO
MADKSSTPAFKLDISKDTTRTGILVVIFILLLTLLVLLIIKPNVSAIAANQTRITERKEALEALQNKVRQLDGAYSNYAQIASDLPILAETIPDDTHLQETLAIIERNASDVVLEAQNALAITGITIEDTPDTLALSRRNPMITGLEQRQDVTIVVSARGDYQALKQFIVLIKNDRRNFQLKRVSLSAPKSSNGAVLDATITLNTFYYAETI